MELIKIENKSKKTGKPYTAYAVKIGEYQTPMFFPSKVELIYIQEQLRKNAHSDFQHGWLDGEED